ncbi:MULTISPECIES: zeta toxin family protein [unclassified Pseudomonas]|uniref:zeta toxin family protein n=1 Tax=unclassified Pseudomonas TaxID=196821 RepID=UPI0015A08E0C|nr:MULTISPECIES: zeta toxin family protein [unclassified Pseudomonas]NWC90871.1 zeta toxin family protein [Pseudomonas sp. IPO3779]NWD17001.1 zeta toxin family protein [Pseudomonas sp. IPO3778]
MTPEEIVIEQAAFEFAKANRASLARHVADTAVFFSEDAPFTVFMAGSPGAGKAEISKAMAEVLEARSANPQVQRVLRIDPDDFRCLIPGYEGSNSYLFQRAVTKILENVLDRAFEKRLSFILDGTMANIEVAKRNIDRVLGNGRNAQIMYVYQRPELAWQFVQAREITEGRNIPLVEFSRQFLAARRNVIELKRLYGGLIHVDLLIKDFDGLSELVELDASTVAIDALIPETYDQAQLTELLAEV